LRIVSGKWRGRKLKAGPGVRPTTDRMKEAVFSALCSRIELAGLRVLDVFAGSGALGLEAISRGAEHVTFVEASKKAAEALRANFQSLKAEDSSLLLLESQAERYLASSKDQFDLIFADPPYDYSDSSSLLEDLLERLSSTGLIVLETAAKTELKALEGLEMEKDVVFGESRYRILSKKVKR